ncbi:hypothetical protein ACWEOS_31090 [Micromonospora taraxaci]|uniref:hypothetical protein n=1 Tax=Micromonospora taraxaci TaxID=1316803 RepID=UPI0033BB1CA3
MSVAEWLGPVVTGAVGVAGIGGTILSAVLTRRTQVEVTDAASLNALLVEKRQLYARFLRIMEDAYEAAGEMREVADELDRMTAKLVGAGELTDTLRQELKRDLERLSAKKEWMQQGRESSFGELKRVRAEISLLAGAALNMQVARAITLVMGYGARRGEASEVSEALVDVASAMRSDVLPGARGR